MISIFRHIAKTLYAKDYNLLRENLIKEHQKIDIPLFNKRYSLLYFFCSPVKIIAFDIIQVST